MSQKYIPNKQKFRENKKNTKKKRKKKIVIKEKKITVRKIQLFEASSDVNMVLLNTNIHIADIPLNGKYSV
jgi:hypothetical protein